MPKVRSARSDAQFFVTQIVDAVEITSIQDSTDRGQLLLQIGLNSTAIALEDFGGNANKGIIIDLS